MENIKQSIEKKIQQVLKNRKVKEAGKVYEIISCESAAIDKSLDINSQDIQYVAVCRIQTSENKLFIEQNADVSGVVHIDDLFHGKVTINSVKIDRKY